MTSYFSAAARIALLLTCAATAAPTAVRAQGTAGTEAAAYGPAPMEMLFEYGDSLQLSVEQIERLQTLRAGLAQRNEPLVARMIEIRREWQRERTAMRRAGTREDTERLRQLRAEAGPLRQRIQHNNRAAMRQVNRLLTAEQRALLRAIVNTDRRGGAADPSGRRRGVGG